MYLDYGIVRAGLSVGGQHEGEIAQYGGGIGWQAAGIGLGARRWVLGTRCPVLGAWQDAEESLQICHPESRCTLSGRRICIPVFMQMQILRRLLAPQNDSAGGFSRLLLDAGGWRNAKRC